MRSSRTDLGLRAGHVVDQQRELEVQEVFCVVDGATSQPTDALQSVADGVRVHVQRARVAPAR